MFNKFVLHVLQPQKWSFIVRYFVHESFNNWWDQGLARQLTTFRKKLKLIQPSTLLIVLFPRFGFVLQTIEASNFVGRSWKWWAGKNLKAKENLEEGRQKADKYWKEVKCEPTKDCGWLPPEEESRQRGHQNRMYKGLSARSLSEREAEGTHQVGNFQARPIVQYLF